MSVRIDSTESFALYLETAGTISWAIEFEERPAEGSSGVGLPTRTRVNGLVTAAGHAIMDGSPAAGANRYLIFLSVSNQDPTVTNIVSFGAYKNAGTYGVEPYFPITSDVALGPGEHLTYSDNQNLSVFDTSGLFKVAAPGKPK